MSDKVIRIASDQGFSDSWVNANAPTNLNLLDFTIPRGYNINMAESYVAINAQINNNTDNPVNATMWLDTNNNESYNVPTSALIRNCRLENDRSNNVESIRRLDTLKCGLFGLEHDAETRKNNLNTFAAYTNGRGVGNQTSYFLDCVTNNTTNDGGTIDTANKSRNIARDIKIPLNEMFGCCDTEAYSTDVFGETKIHLELNSKKLKSRMLGGAENTDLAFDGATAWGAVETVMGVAVGASVTELELSNAYGDWQYTCPFFVGQEILVTGTDSSGLASPADTPVVITGMRFQDNNTTSPPTNAAKVTLTTNPACFTNAAAGPVNLHTITIKSKVDQVLTNVVNRADLVLHLTNAESPQNLQFESWNVEEDNGANINSFNKGYVLEPEAKAVLIACCNNSEILPVRTCESYRYAIDNVEQTGNRSVKLPAAATQGSPLLYERIQRCLVGQLGGQFRNAQLKFYRNDGTTQANAYNAPVSMICETCEPSQDTKMLNLNIECAANLQQIILYKSITKTI